MARPIIKVYRNTRELTLSVGFLHSCRCPQYNFVDVTLDIILDGCPPDPVLRLETDGCSYWFVEEAKSPMGVRYCLFEVDDDGGLVFYLDDTINELPEGRYVGIIKANDTPLVSFAIDLLDPKFQIISASKEEHRWKN